jgi:hypothetical protein
MYRSIHHRRPVLNGYNGYLPAGFDERMKLAERLPDPQALAELERETGLSAIVVRLNELPDPVKRADWLAIAAEGKRGALRLEGRYRDDLLFSVEPAAADPADGRVP